jgi:hypothetical protein
MQSKMNRSKHLAKWSSNVDPTLDFEELVTRLHYYFKIIRRVNKGNRRAVR